MTIVTLRRPLGAADAIRGAVEKSARRPASAAAATRSPGGSHAHANGARCATSPRIDYLLKDIGVSREEAFREAGKPFWRA